MFNTSSQQNAITDIESKVYSKLTKSELINNRYRIVQSLGEGSMGMVLLVEDRLANNLKLALKKIDSRILDKRTLQIFKKEFELMTRLKHPNVIKVFDFGFDQSSQINYFTMEYIDGPSFKTILQEQGSFSSTQLVPIFIDLCRALSFIQSRKIIHGDINPKNILLSSQKRVVLMDFGLAEVDLEDENKERRGTPLYMAPEVFHNKNCRRSDIFSLGLTFYELLTNEIFYPHLTFRDLLNLVQDKIQFDLHKEKNLSRLSDSLWYPILSKMIAFSIEDRYQTCAEIISDINQAWTTNYSFESPETRDAYVLGAGFVGRDHELQVLKDKLQKPYEIHKILWVKGEAGVGKSRLFYEFRNWCQIHGINFLTGTCNEHIRIHFGPFLPIISEILLLANKKILNQYGPELKKILPLHEALQSITINPTYDPQTEHFLLVKAIVALLTSLAGKYTRGCVLYLNDLHWVDEASIDVINLLLEKIDQANEFPNKAHSSGFHLYFSSRLQVVEKLESIATNTQVCIMQLHPFDQQLVTGYIESVFGEKMLSIKFLNTLPVITHSVGGNPFFLQELIKSLIMKGAIVRHREYWELTKTFKKIKIPDTLKDLINERLIHFPMNDHEREVLHIVALLNRPVSWEELNEITPTDLDLLLRLEQEEILRSEVTLDCIGFSLGHDLIQETIIRTISHKEQLHGKIAQSLESAHSSNLVGIYEELAHHYTQANNREKAIHYLDCAGERARSNFENQKALSFFQKELTLLQENEIKRDIDVRFKMGQVYWTAGNFTGAVKVLKKATEIAELHKDYSQAAQVYWLYSHILVGNDDKLSKINAEKALSLAEKINHKSLIARSYNVLGIYHIYETKDYERAISYFKRGKAIALECNDIYGIIANTGNLSLVYGKLGKFTKALEANNFALTHAPENPEFLRPKAFGYAKQGKYYTGLGDYESALKYFDKSIWVSKKIGCITINIQAQVGKGELLFQYNYYNEVRKICDQLENKVDKIPDHYMILRYKILKAKIMYVTGEKNKGENILLDLLKICDQKSDIATLHYELWCLNKKAQHRNTAMQLYQELSELSKTYKYKKCLQELRENGSDI